MADYWQPQPAFPGSQYIHNNQSCMSAAAMRDMMYCFPRPRHTGRVTKPRSAGNSPSAAGRRRAAAFHSSPIYQPTPSQGYQVPFDAALLASAIRKQRAATRPISWHPASLASPEYLSPNYFPSSTAAFDNLGVMNMNAHQLDPSMADMNGMAAYAPTGITNPSDDLSFSGLPDPASMQQPPYHLQMNGPQVEQVSWDTSASHVPAMTEPMSDAWAFDMMSMQNSIPSADIPGSSYASVPSSGCLSGPSTPDFLPIQQPETTSKPLPQETGDELIGMGLYNQPENYPDHSMQGHLGKGLKLEETFSPSDDEADDSKDAENEEEDDDVEFKGSKEFQPYKPPVKSAGNMMHKSFFFDDEPEQPAPAYQQFFNLGGQPCMSYGYGWL